MFSCRYTSVCKHQKMQQLGWNTLEVSTNQARAVMMYRIVNRLIAIPASLYLTPNTQNTIIREDMVVSSMFQLGVAMLSTTVSFLSDLKPIAGCCHYVFFLCRLMGIPATQTSI